MSRSKRAAQTPPDTKTEGGLFTDGLGRWRTGWLLAVSLLAWLAASLLVRGGLSALFAALFRAWGIDETTAARAPGWARLLYAWHGSLITALFAAATLALSRLLRRLWKLPVGAPRVRVSATRYWLLGTGMAALIAALCLLPDSLRPEWPLSAPRLSGALPALWVLNLLSVFAEEAFVRRVVFDGLRDRWGGGWAAVCACALFFAMNGGWAGNLWCALNVALLAAACCLLYIQKGLWSVTMLRWGWSFANVFLLGFGGGDSAVYRLYSVSEGWLTGGDAGFICGAWATLLLAALAAWLAREAMAALPRRLRRGQ